MSRILIENGIVVTLDDTSKVLAPGYVYVEGNKIAVVEEGSAPLEIRRQADQVLDASRMAVLPGLVNAHVHLAQSFIRGLGGHQPLLEWLEEVLWPVIEHMTPKDVYLAAKLSLLENIRGGATAVIHNSCVHPGDADDRVFQAAEEMGLRYTMARGWADRNYRSTIKETPDRIMTEMERLYQAWHGQAGGRLRVGFGPLIPWGCSEETLRRNYELATSWDTCIHLHTAESQAEVELSLESTGKRHVEWLADLGILGPHMHLVHSVWLSDQEIELVAESGSIVVHNPVCNMTIASGIPRITEMQRRGVTVALGTDGQAVNNGHEMVDVLGVASDLQKVGTLDAMALSPEEVLRMACQGGAKALGQPDLLGSLEPGKAADLVLLDLDNPRTMMVQSVPYSLVNQARHEDVRTVIVDGEILMQDGRITTVDEGALLEEARLAYRDLLHRAGIETVRIDQGR